MYNGAFLPKNDKGYWPLTTFAKNSIVNVPLVFKYTSGQNLVRSIQTTSLLWPSRENQILIGMDTDKEFAYHK